MEAPPTTLYQWLNFCFSVTWKSTLRNAYFNDNRLFLDDLAHTCMLQDIIKLHGKAGLSPPNFVSTTLANISAQATLVGPALDNTVLSENYVPTTVRPGHTYVAALSQPGGTSVPATATQLGGNAILTTVRPGHTSYASTYVSLSSSPPPHATQPGGNAVLTTARPGHTFSQPGGTSVPATATQLGWNAVLTTVRPGHTSYAITYVSLPSSSPPHATQLGGNAVLTTARPGHTSSQPVGTMVPTQLGGNAVLTTVRPGHTSVAPTSFSPPSSPPPHATQPGGNAVLTTVRPGHTISQPGGIMVPTTVRLGHTSSQPGVIVVPTTVRSGHTSSASSSSTHSSFFPSPATQPDGNAVLSTVRLGHTPDPSNGNSFCYECGQLAQTTKASHNHMRLSHGVFPLSKYLVDGHCCKVCLKQFPNISRVYQHLEHDSQSCLAAWDSLDLRLNAAQLAEVEDVRKAEAKYFVSLGFRETKSLAPIFRVPAPLRTFTPDAYDIHRRDIPTMIPSDDNDLITPPVDPPPSVVSMLAHTDNGALAACAPDQIDPETLPLATYFPLLKLVQLNVKLILHLFSGQDREGKTTCRLSSKLNCFNPVCVCVQCFCSLT